jgi:putative endonuclease
MVYTLYILECTDGTLYTGITTDLARRFTEHQQGIGSRYTRAHGARRIVYSEVCPDRSSASKRESAIKSLSRKEKETLVASVSATEV